jgi:hypothetical protein
MKTALLVIATGKKYRDYANCLMDSANICLFPHDVILFTDLLFPHPDYTLSLEHGNKLIPVSIDPKGFPTETLMRYHTFLSAESVLSKYLNLFYVDSDMLFVSSVKEDDILSDGITATEHPGYINLNGTPERNPESTAYCPIVRNYFCGGFNGGTTGEFLQMSKTIAAAIDQDTKKGIKAVWNDESHLNRYLYDNPPARILSPSFCYPESEYRNPGGYYHAIWQAAGRGKIEPKLLALDKIK